MPAAMRYRAPRSHSKQNGAVLYIALIMLVLLALLGVVGLQVSGLQERMAYNYRTLNLAFQRAEARAREAECFVEGTVNRVVTACAAVTVEPVCDKPFDASSTAQGWAAAEPAVDALSVRSIGKCIAGNSSLGMGRQPENEDPNPVFQVTVFSNDGVGQSAGAAVDTIFRP